MLYILYSAGIFMLAFACTWGHTYNWTAHSHRSMLEFLVCDIPQISYTEYIHVAHSVDTLFSSILHILLIRLGNIHVDPAYPWQSMHSYIVYMYVCSIGSSSYHLRTFNSWSLNLIPPRCLLPLPLDWCLAPGVGDVRPLYLDVEERSLSASKKLVRGPTCIY